MKIIVTGATGFVGAKLVPALRARGDEVIVLSRDADAAKAKLGVTAVQADLETRGAWCDALAGAGAIVHLAGESVTAKRWSARQKQVIRDSRVESTRTLVEALAALPAADRPRVLISSSGTDFYPYAVGALDDDEVTERDPPSDEFLARICRDWEHEARAAEPLGVRVACLRIGLVLGGGGGLAKMTTPFKLFVGGKLASGKQWVSWIHRDDVVGLILAALADARYTGPLNAVTDSIRNRDFAKTLGKALGRPSWLPVPRFALKLAVGELATVIANGRRVVPARARELGYKFLHPELEAALRAALAE